MKRIYLDTLLLLADSLHNRISIHVDAGNWPEVFSELKAHAVASLVAKNMANIQLPSEEKIQFMQILGYSFKNFHAICIEQSKLQMALNNAGINVAILKGTAASMYYENPEYRAMGDIDLIVLPAHLNSASSALTKVGFSILSSVEGNKRHLNFVSESGIEIELHFKYSSSDDEEYNRILDEMIYDALNRVEVNVVSGYEVSTLPKLENGIILLYHINHHLRGGLGLRQMIDWMMYVEKCLDDSFWEKEFCREVNRIGLEKLALITTAACKKYLGLRSDITWCDSGVDEELVDCFMEYIMDNGNFGRKDAVNSDATVVLRKFRDPIQGFRFAQQKGKENWSLLRKHHWLKPFAWFYQLVRWIRLGVARGVSVSDVGKINKKEKRVFELLKQIEATRF